MNQRVNGVLGWCVAGLLVLVPRLLLAQTISGVVERGEYVGGVTFTVVAEAGYDITATLNGDSVAIGLPTRVDRMDFYELTAQRIPDGGGGTITTNTIHFIVLSPERGSPERGLIKWTPYPLIPSAAGEFADAELELMVPRDYPLGLEIPVVAWVRDAQRDEVRVNGAVTAAGHPGHSIRILRGVGSGFLSPATSSGALMYPARLQTLAHDKTIAIDATTAWTRVSGMLPGATTWAANARIHLDGGITVPAGASLTIEEGAVVKVDAGVNITNSGEVAILGTLARPVVLTATNRVSPGIHTHAWGGFVMRGPQASLVANGTILSGGGSATQWDFSPGASHRSEQPVLFVHSGARATLTDSAVINTAGQVGNGYNSDVTFARTLLQRAITAGEYVGGTILLDHAALIEFPEDNGEVTATIAEADYDGIYFTTGTHILENSLIGFCKDDAIDSGSGGAGTVVVSNCWLESALHEAMGWSGGGRVTRTFDTVAINNGQGFECGWSTGADSPLCYGENMLLIGNAVGARLGDNYTWSYNGQMQVTNSLMLYNNRDVWGYTWDQWTYRTDQMDMHGNRVTQSDPRHPGNTLWVPASDGALLDHFLTIPPTANVGIGMATWSGQAAMSALGQGVPVRLSSFSTRPVSVRYQAYDASAALLESGTLTFAPGQTVATIPVNVPDPHLHDLVRVVLDQPVNGELTGARSFVFIRMDSSGGPGEAVLIARGDTWKYHDLGQDLAIAWRGELFDDSGWSEGPAELGAGDGGEATVINIGPAGARLPTVYFRKTMTVPEPHLLSTLNFGLRRDDGAAVYLNGAGVYRDSNVPPNAGFSTYATALTPSESAYVPFSVSASFLQAGDNVVAVELHQESATSSDLSFDLDLIGIPHPALDIVQFGSDLLLYWLEPGYHLQSADRVSGPWNPMSVISPAEVQPSRPRQFFRLSSGGPTGSALYVPAGYSLFWHDQFNGSTIDTGKWVVARLRDPVSGDLVPGASGDHLLNSQYAGYVTEEDSYVEKGSLILLNQKRPYTGTSPEGRYDYTSGWIMSMHRGHFNRGYVEIRAKFPSGPKVWPAFWLVAEDLVWGPEWDMWEYFGERSDVGPDIMGNHLAVDRWPNVKWSSSWIHNFDATYDCESWHIYGFEWTASNAVWSIDGAVVHTLGKSASADPAQWPDEEMYIILNNGVRTASPDTATTWPNQVEVDYIEVYK